jgi:hypothetical protein
MSIKERNFFFTIEPMKTEHKNLWIFEQYFCPQVKINL